MSYYDLSDALEDLEPSQVSISLGGRDGEHSVTLNGLCTDGMIAVMSHLVRELNLDGENLIAMIPQLKDVKVADLLPLILEHDSDYSDNIIDVIVGLGKNSSGSSSGKIAVGDTFTASRKVVADNGNHVTYEDDAGVRNTVQRSSFRSWAKNKKKA